nr:uncharacterized protein LOC123760015 isoform X1 [Procambarus clarkii]XP_045601326.1 uncharacterized protein LOC123760015 isoform X1 [Procambarus clarkii]XP_045601327.1 uncharacterized protein LOC123760015 isoform X1 [Procambarus clarkii]XP_045601328.1 uncharacterized protein LOC123760015 isoform X1 [Procambarus clarkii]
MESKDENLSEDHSSQPGKDLGALSLYKNVNSECNIDSRGLESKKISPTHSSKAQLSLPSWGLGKPHNNLLGVSEPKNSAASDASMKSRRSSIIKHKNSKTCEGKIQKPEINEDTETECSTDDHESYTSHGKSGTDETSDEDGEETVIETSFEENSFNTSVYSEKGNDSSSELSIDPVIWTKFKFLSSILKETQHNLRAMDNLILEHRRLQDLSTVQADQSREHTVVNHITIPVQQGLGDGEPKTDEAKLEEILSLLHNLTHTLSSYEQHPLLASTLQSPGTVAASHGLVTTHTRYLQPTSHSPETKNNDNDNSMSYSHSHHLMNTEQNKHAYDSHLQSNPSSVWPGRVNKNEGMQNKSIDGYESGVKESNIAEASTSQSHIISRNSAAHNHEPSYTNVELLGGKHESETSVYPDFTPHDSVTERNIEKNAHESNATQFSKPFVKEPIIQIVPSVSEIYSMPNKSDMYYCHTEHHSEGLDSLQSQDISHPWMKETRSLRKDIEDIVVRKQALDTRLQALIAHRAAQRDLELHQLEISNGRHVRLMRSHSLEEVDNRKLKTKIRKYKKRSKSYEDKPYQQRKSGTSVSETYLSMINEDQDEFPSLTMENTENDEKITELQHDEADLPGLGDSGLSSEINSINATIQELVRENHQLHKFLQGMTCESIFKVDQEKLALEARIQLLSEENEALKLSLNDEECTVDESETKHSNKTVSFCIDGGNDEEPEAKVYSINTDETNKVMEEDGKKQTQDNVSHSLINSVKLIPITLGESKSSQVEKDIFNHANDQPLFENEEILSSAKPQSLVEVDLAGILKVEVEHLTQENQNLLKIIEEERKISEGARKQLTEISQQQEVKKDAKETQTDLKGDTCSVEADSYKEMEKLHIRIKKLTEEKEKLSCKLYEEVSDRDLESARLEARIRILSEQKQNLTEKLNEVTSSKIDMVEKSCQSELAVYHADLSGDRDGESILTVTVSSVYDANAQAKSTIGVPDVNDLGNLERVGCSLNMQDTRNNEDMITCANVSTTMTILEDSSAFVNDTIQTEANLDNVTVQGIPNSSSEAVIRDNEIILSDNSTPIPNLGKNISITRSDQAVNINDGDTTSSSFSTSVMTVASEKLHETVSGGKADYQSAIFKNSAPANHTSRSLNTEKHCIVLLDQNTGRVQNEIGVDCDHSHIYNQDSKDDSKLMLQLDELLKQNEVITHSLNDLKSSALTSETSLESTIMKVMEKHGKLIQNIDEKLTIARSSDKCEYESSLMKLTRGNQELFSILEQQQEKIELLINENSSLERKLQIAQTESKEKYSVDGERETPQVLRMSIESANEANEETFLEMEDKKIVASTFPGEDSHHDSEFLTENCENVPVGREDINSPQGKNAISGDEGNTIQSSTQSQSSDPLDTRSKPQNYTWGPTAERKTMENGQGSEGLLTLTLKREKENWTLLLQQAENEKQILQDRIITLVNENNCLAARLEEVVGMSRNLSDQMHSAKDQLIKVTTEKEDLQKKVRSLEEGKEYSSLSLSDSIGSTRFTQRLRERTRNLQSEVEQAWQEVHQRTIERDRVSAEKESLECTYTISLNTARKEIEALKSQLTVVEKEKDKRLVELTNTQNELERRSADMMRAAQDTSVAHWDRLLDAADRRLESLQNELRKGQEQLQKEREERKSVEAKLEEIKKQKISSAPVHIGESELLHTRGERYWLETVTRLKGQLQQEQLRSRLLEAADHESSARILILQRSIRETIEAHETLQAKYNQLRSAYRAKKAEKIRHRELSQQYTAQVKELGKTSAALEENFKIMLAALGENIDITVGILTSHVFLSPCVVHPGPDLRLDPEAWFGAQQARLRWLQTQLRKLCLHSWKMADLPKTSNFVTQVTESSVTEPHPTHFTTPTKTPKFSTDVGHKSSCLVQTSENCTKKNDLSQLSILDESRSYTVTPVKKVNVSSISVNAASSEYESPYTGKGPISENLHSLRNVKLEKFSNVTNIPTQEQQVTNACTPDIAQLSRSSKSLNEAERILTSQQRELSEAKYRQYKALIYNLQRDLEYPMVLSPSVPSSMITTPENIPAQYHDFAGESEHDSEVSTSEMPVSQASSSRTLVSPVGTGSSSQLLSQSLKDKDLPSVAKDVSENQIPSMGNTMSSETKSSLEFKDLLLKVNLPSQENLNTSKEPNKLANLESLGKERERQKVSMLGEFENESGSKDCLKEERASHGLDSDKDKDSWEGNGEEDFIFALVKSEVDDHDMD